MDLLGRQQADAAVVVAVVVPVEELAAEGAGILDGAEAVGKFGAADSDTFRPPIPI
jgi:hypothetical protein